jgi:hypothetical protein
MPCGEYTPGAVFTTLPFLCNLLVGSTSWSVRLHKAGKACWDKHSSWLRPHLQVTKKMQCGEYTLGAVFTTLHFLCNLLVAQQTRVLYHSRSEKLAGTNTLADRAHLQVTKNMPCGEYTHGAIFTTLHFRCNLQVGPTKWSVRLQ